MKKKYSYIHTKMNGTTQTHYVSFLFDRKSSLYYSQCSGLVEKMMWAFVTWASQCFGMSKNSSEQTSLAW